MRIMTDIDIFEVDRVSLEYDLSEKEIPDYLEVHAWREGFVIISVGRFDIKGDQERLEKSKYYFMKFIMLPLLEKGYHTFKFEPGQMPDYWTCYS